MQNREVVFSLPYPKYQTIQNYFHEKQFVLSTIFELRISSTLKEIGIHYIIKECVIGLYIKQLSFLQHLSILLFILYFKKVNRLPLEEGSISTFFIFIVKTC